jgi:hypothetical protein
MQRQKLVGEIGIDLRVQANREVHEKQVGFYRKYAVVAQRTLSRPLFQGFLGWILTEESIERGSISKIEVMLFPFRNGKGNWLAGRISRKGEIFLYPKKKEFCQRLMQEFERNNVYFYIKARAMAALIHELLHLRYASDENMVRQKTEKYFQIFIWNEYVQNPKIRSILKMLFTAEALPVKGQEFDVVHEPTAIV